MSKRPSGLWLQDGSPSPDDFIPRCMDARNAPRSTYNEPEKSDALKHLWSKSFSARVNDAMVRLKRKENIDYIRSLHGSIVLRQALQEISK